MVCDRYGLLLAGGYAMTAHGLSGRPAGELSSRWSRSSVSHSCDADYDDFGIPDLD